MRKSVCFVFLLLGGWHNSHCQIVVMHSISSACGKFPGAQGHRELLTCIVSVSKYCKGERLRGDAAVIGVAVGLLRIDMLYSGVVFTWTSLRWTFVWLPHHLSLDDSHPTQWILIKYRDLMHPPRECNMFIITLLGWLPFLCWKCGGEMCVSPLCLNIRPSLVKRAVISLRWNADLLISTPLKCRWYFVHLGLSCAVVQCSLSV